MRYRRLNLPLLLEGKFHKVLNYLDYSGRVVLLGTEGSVLDQRWKSADLRRLRSGSIQIWLGILNVNYSSLWGSSFSFGRRRIEVFFLFRYRRSIFFQFFPFN